ncbi:IS66 family insertion sequence element accessory protein TnpB [Fulvivirga sp. M361]|nr:IS66 family insertion sequence element accessory protein TnpB [Fulvivirga sp. M361]
MRFGIYSLSGLVRNELGQDPLSGDVFVFIGKRANQVRLLQWDRDGFALYIKKLEQGTFEWPQGEDICITSHQLSFLCTGGNVKNGAHAQALQCLRKGLKKH